MDLPKPKYKTQSSKMHETINQNRENIEDYIHKNVSMLWLCWLYNTHSSKQQMFVVYLISTFTPRLRNEYKNCVLQNFTEDLTSALEIHLICLATELLKLLHLIN